MAECSYLARFLHLGIRNPHQKFDITQDVAISLNV